MKWVLIIVYLSSLNEGVVVEQFPTLIECHTVGARAQKQYEQAGGTGALSFSCMPSTGGEPTCGGTGQPACK